MACRIPRRSKILTRMSCRIVLSRGVLIVLSSVLLGLLNQSSAGTEEVRGIRLELNKFEDAGSKCRLYLLLRENAGVRLASLKVDFVVFGSDGAIAKRVGAELGPVRPNKTMVRIFDLDLPCSQISSLLLNDVTECGPGMDAETCLGQLSTDSRLSVGLVK